jgi:type I restriction enzyme S subunit
MADLSTPTHDGQSEQTAQSLITQHIDIWTTAIEQKSSAGRGTSNKFSLYGIKKLRELILELAVRGKLVPQDPNDEPAAVLLERIAAEKVQLVQDKKIKSTKTLSEIGQEEKLSELPNGWSRARLGEIFHIVYGKGLPNSKLTETGYKVFGANGIIGYYSEYKYEQEQLLVSCRGAYSGKPNISPSRCFVTSNSLVLENTWELVSQKYFFYSLTIADKREIVTGSAQPQVTTTNLEPFIISIPPLDEQHRIVAKVDELMSLCDALEAQTEASIAAHQTLVETLLNALLLPNTTQPADSQSASPESSFANSLEPALNESFIESWQRVAEHFDTLFTTEASIDTLKQTILQLAVMGKLVKQDPNDEPAAKLLERIAAEKEQLIKDGKIKKQKPLPAITDEEKPFELPKGWEWCYLQDITLLITDGKHGDCNNLDNSGFYFLSAKDIQNGKLIYDNARQIVESEFAEIHQRTNLEAGDICMVNTGATVGKMAIAEEHSYTSKSTFQKSVAVIKVANHYISNRYIALFLESETPNLLKKSGGSAINNLLLGDLKKKLSPLPPQEEQHRIVAKVDELMALCDQLKARLSDSQTTQLHLTDAIVEQAI